MCGTLTTVTLAWTSSPSALARVNDTRCSTLTFAPGPAASDMAGPVLRCASPLRQHDTSAAQHAGGAAAAPQGLHFEPVAGNSPGAGDCAGDAHATGMLVRPSLFVLRLSPFYLLFLLCIQRRPGMPTRSDANLRSTGRLYSLSCGKRLCATTACSSEWSRFPCSSGSSPCTAWRSLTAA